MSILFVTALHPEKTVAALSPFLSGQEITVCKCTGLLHCFDSCSWMEIGRRRVLRALLPDLQSRAQKLTPMHVLQI